MAISATAFPQPPANAPPIADDGQHSQAWANYFGSISDALRKIALGVTDGSDAVAGNVGEYVSASGSVGLSGSGVAVVATLPLTAGDWSVEGNVSFVLSGSTAAWQGLASVSLGTGAPGPVFQNITVPAGWTTSAIGSGGAVRQSLSAATLVYLVAQGSILGGVGTLNATGTVWARRVR